MPDWRRATMALTRKLWEHRWSARHSWGDYRVGLYLVSASAYDARLAWQITLFSQAESHWEPVAHERFRFTEGGYALARTNINQWAKVYKGPHGCTPGARAHELIQAADNLPAYTRALALHHLICTPMPDWRRDFAVMVGGGRGAGTFAFQ